VSIDIPEDIRYGPFIDTVVYKLGFPPSVTAIALQEGHIDIGDIYVEDYSFYAESSYFEVLECPRNGISCINFNCEKYPLNISGFRRAIAFAFNKSKAVDYVYEGHATLHDSVIPSQNRWCAEDHLDYHYYEADIERGNSLLIDLGFILNATSGFRETPNGEPFNVTVYASPSPESRRIAQLTCEALDSLNVDNIHHDYFPYPFPPSNYMIVAGRHLEYDTIVWEDRIYSNYRNDSFSYWIEQYHTGKTYEDVFEAAVQIQKNLHHNVPQLVVCQENNLEAIMNDQFQEYVEDQSRYFSGPWTARRVHKIDGSYGGEFSIASGYIGWPYSFNFYTNSRSKRILDNVYSSLYIRDPNMNPIPDLAESMIVETHVDNPSVPQNHTRFTFDILQNATWSDGMPLTAEDIAFTFIYQLESSIYGNPAAESLNDLVSVFAPSPNRVIFEFSSESYWNFYKIAYEYIIPKHIFTTIGHEGWNSWNPVFDPEEPHVTCGPFQLTDFETGGGYDWFELTVYPDYHWLPYRPLQQPNTTTTTTPNTQDPTMLFFSVTAYSVIAVGVIVLLIKDRKHSE
jgi:ABC-type transport system substrate-binding protein